MSKQLAITSCGEQNIQQPELVLVVSSDEYSDDQPPRRSAKRRSKQIVLTDSDHQGETSNAREKSMSFYERKARREEREARLQNQIKRYNKTILDQHRKIKRLKKKVKSLKGVITEETKGREAIRMVAKNHVEHGIVVSGLKKELAEARAESERRREMVNRLTVEVDSGRARLEKLKKVVEGFNKEMEDGLRVKDEDHVVGG